ncbi:MAG: 16S rRNA (cytosine(967)-C(5))-methyltransferase RsmB [Burkholderiales bacterium]|jgi:16S rRNA (cytosine967-C5)-methyltransferase|nr:16S rRNA (cytosine(967)-C(5))-methyltransferase RsmB [Burkholderiales bacterium]
MHASQRLSAQIVRDVLVEGVSLPDALARDSATLPPAVRGFVQELVYGTLRHWGVLSALVDLLVVRPPSPPLLRYLLAGALYQLLHMRQPPFAVVNHAVDAAKKIQPQSGAFINAALRRFLREKELLLTQAKQDPVARFSHPRWWITRLRKDFPKNWSALLDEGNKHPPLTLRVNTRQISRSALLARFADVGIAATPVGAVGVLLEAARDVVALPGFEQGLFSVQDLAAQYAAPLLDARDGMRVLDACAAPGGKTTHLLELADIELLALDNDVSRLPRVAENLVRLHLTEKNVDCLHADAADPAAWWDKKPFDRILLDAPCSASGIARRHPDIKWLRRATDISRFAEKQHALLVSLWPLLATGGSLLYVTCSLFREENDIVLAEFCARQRNARHEIPAFDDNSPHLGGQLLPNSHDARHNQDGLYYAMLRKIVS